MNGSVTQSLALAKHLRQRDATNVEWLQRLDQLFLSAAYVKPEESPFFSGPDNLPYYAFHVARSHGVEQQDLKEGMDSALHWATGGVVYPGGGLEEWIYSPGDLVSLAVLGTSVLQWKGDWAKEPIVEDYTQGQTINISRPSPQSFAPLAARCLEAITRRVFQAESLLRDRLPAIAIARPESRTLPEQASELMLNAYESDFASKKRWDDFQILVRRFLPSHLARRLISFEKPLFPDERFTPLIELVKEGGLEPVPVIE